MNKLPIATAAAAFLIAIGLPARASGCYESLAAGVIANSIRGGLSPSRSVEQATNEGYINGEACLIRTIGYMRSMPILYGDVVK